jgi:anthranilate synthase component 1
MLVDLARNDLGAVSQPGSVTVSELLKVKHYSHVSHITSTVTGQLQDGYDALDAFKAAFPAGTLSGAPKIRAMEIIDSLENSGRGLYGGAICRLDPVGNLESCIAIRMAHLQDGIATIRTGAGVVYDSNPCLEAQETYNKAQSILEALAIAHGEKARSVTCS